MKRYIITLLFIITLSLSIFGQDSISKNGYVVLKHDNGKIASEGIMKDGLPDGYWKSYNKKGILISEGNRASFMLDSLWKFYNEDGLLLMTVNYTLGKKNGKKNTFLQNEVIEETYKNNLKVGFEKHFDKNKKLIKVIPFLDGLEDGIAKEYNELGNIILLTEYKKGYVIKREFINRLDGSGLKQGLWKSFYDNDIQKFEGYYLNNKKNGFFKEFDINGNLTKIEKYENDQLIIDALETRKLEMRVDYFKNGKQRIIGTYYNGVAEGVRREYNEKGQVIQSYLMKSGFVVGKGIMDDNGLKQGAWEEYYDENYSTSSAKILRAKGNYKNSKPVGVWNFFFLNGKIEIEGSYNENGKKEGLWSWYYPNGNMLVQENYLDGKREGLYTEYDDKKNVIVKGNFIEDKEDGKWYRANNDYIEEGKYTEGQREGSWKGFYKNGNVCYECNYNDNNFDGKYLRFWENGRIREQGTYILGLKNGSWKSFDALGNLFLIVTYKKGVEIRFEGVKIEPTLDENEVITD